jgi:hypothetical protein
MGLPQASTIVISEPTTAADAADAAGLCCVFSKLPLNILAACLEVRFFGCSADDDDGVTDVDDDDEDGDDDDNNDDDDEDGGASDEDGGASDEDDDGVTDDDDDGAADDNAAFFVDGDDDVDATCFFAYARTAAGPFNFIKVGNDSSVAAADGAAFFGFTEVPFSLSSSPPFPLFFVNSLSAAFSATKSRGFVDLVR